MDIRSVTLFCEPTFDRARAAAFYAAARTAFTVPVQTVRLATPPFPDWMEPENITAQAQAFAADWGAAGADYISVGPVQMGHDGRWLDALPELLSATAVLFASMEIGDENGRFNLQRIRHTAATVQKISRIHPNGFGNLYATAIANCPPVTPFFPVAYHRGGEPAFALALEAADIAVTAIEAAATLAEARRNLVTAIEAAAKGLEKTAVSLANQHNIPFAGIDFSLAPYPEDGKSLAAAMEALGVPHIGASGSLFAAAFITEAIDRADFHRCGFSGLMLPVLEDSVLAARAQNGAVTVNELLSYAAVCGVGLDTIPLAGEVSVEELTAVFLDIAALAARLNKPLTARLMPLPGLAVGDKAAFDFPYFADGWVMAVKGDGVKGVMGGNGRLQIKQRPVAGSK